jgi:predicted O-methyltransferase YrrM
MTPPPQLPQPLVALQAQAQLRSDFHPETSSVLHADLYHYVVSHHTQGHGLLEIGCYKGSSSLVLAYAARELGMPFQTIDINRAYLDDTRHLLEDLGLADRVSYFHGTMTEFAQRVDLDRCPLLVFVDGDHTYPAVVRDIQAIYQLSQRPAAIAFHDYSLRSHRYDGIRVDLAIRAAFGPSVELRRIGVQFGAQPVPSRAQPSASGSYWEIDGSEGVIVETQAYEHLMV